MRAREQKTKTPSSRKARLKSHRLPAWGLPPFVKGKHPHRDITDPGQEKWGWDVTSHFFVRKRAGSEEGRGAKQLGAHLATGDLTNRQSMAGLGLSDQSSAQAIA
jgi:hypothetical protein